VLQHVLAVLLVAGFIATGSCGQATLEHWDEDALIAKVRASVVNRGTLLPDSYDWPSVSYWIALGALAPEAIGGPAPVRGSIHSLEAHLVHALDTTAYRLRVRRFFLVISSLTIVWVYLTGLVLGRGAWTALFGAALVATSWEVAYHARWAAPDGPLMQWAALSLLGAAFALRYDETRPPNGERDTSRWAWRFSAVAAGAAVGTKYNAWPLVVALMVARGRGRPTRVAIEVGVVAVGAFLVTTPGAFFQPVQFVSGLQHVWTHYTTADGQHAVGAGIPHLLAELRYLGTALWSPWAALAVPLAALAIPGAVDLVRRRPRAGIVIVGFPLGYLCYFAAHRLFIARNVLITAPFIAVLVAWGAGVCFARMRSFALRTAVVVLLAGVIAVDAVWLVGAARSRVGAASLRGVADDFGRQGELCATPSVVAAFARAEVALPSNVMASCATALQVALYRFDLPIGVLPAYGPRVNAYGREEVNYTYYPDWVGGEPVLLLAVGRARGLGAHLP
jgi:hypothetical protein